MPVTYQAVKQQAGVGVNQVIAVPLTAINATNVDANETLKVTVLNGVTADASGNIAAQATPKGGTVRLENFQILYNSPSQQDAARRSRYVHLQGGRLRCHLGPARNGVSAAATVTVNVVEYVPKLIAGYVYIDKGAGGQVALAGVAVTLTGKTFTAVDGDPDPAPITVYTDSTGHYQFPNLAPPKTTYTITEGQPKYLLNGSSMNMDGGSTVTGTTRRVARLPSRGTC